jgi:hypothetical protein
MSQPRYANRESLPRVVEGKLTYKGKVWIVERLAFPRLSCASTVLAEFRRKKKPKKHPLLGRAPKSSHLLCVEEQKNGRLSTRKRWLWLLDDVAEVERLAKALEERRVKAVEAAASGEPTLDFAEARKRNVRWTARERENNLGWGRQARRRLNGTPLRAKKEPRSVGRNRVRKVATYSAKECLAVNDSLEPPQLVRAIDLAKELDRPVETVYRWEHNPCSLFGDKTIPMIRKAGRIGGGRIRETLYVPKHIADRLVKTHAKSEESVLTIFAGCRQYDLSEQIVRDALRRPHTAFGEVIITPTPVFATTNDTSTTRNRRHVRRRKQHGLTIAQWETLARYYAAKDGKPHGLTDAVPKASRVDNPIRVEHNGKIYIAVCDARRIYGAVDSWANAPDVTMLDVTHEHRARVNQRNLRFMLESAIQEALKTRKPAAHHLMRPCDPTPANEPYRDDEGDWFTFRQTSVLLGIGRSSIDALCRNDPRYCLPRLWYENETEPPRMKMIRFAFAPGREEARAFHRDTVLALGKLLGRTVDFDSPAIGTNGHSANGAATNGAALAMPTKTEHAAKRVKGTGGRPRKWDHAVEQWHANRRGNKKLTVDAFCKTYESTFADRPHPAPSQLREALKTRKKANRRYKKTLGGN